MNEGQGKPKRWYKKFFNENDEVASFIWFVLAIAFAGVIIYLVASGSCGEDCSETCLAYKTTREEMRNAVISYKVDHNGSLPTLSGKYTVTSCDNCSIVNVSALLTSNRGMLSTYPQGLYFSNITGMDNWNGNASLVFSNYGSYIWLVDSTGNLYSYCAGAGCETNNSDYQGVWP